MPDFANLSLFSSLAGTAAQTAADVRASRTAADVYSAEAESERAAGRYNAEIARDQGRRVIGKQRAIAGASGLATTSGTPLDIMLESAKQAELEALSAQYESESRARNLSMRGQYAKRGAGSAIAQGIVRGGTYFSDWYNRYGMLPPKKKKQLEIQEEDAYGS